MEWNEPLLEQKVPNPYAQTKVRDKVFLIIKINQGLDNEAKAHLLLNDLICVLMKGRRFT